MINMTRETIVRTEPATEQNLSLENDIHPFDSKPNKVIKSHPVIVDGIIGEACGVSRFVVLESRWNLVKKYQSWDVNFKPNISDS